MKIPNNSFIITSKDHRIYPSFQGYAFSGSNLIIGQDGYNKFIASGQAPEYDSDGCYIHVENLEERKVKVSTDFHGYYPLFYYRDKNHWAASSSLEHLARTVRSNGWSLSRRQHQLEAWRSNRAILLQLSSRRTVFNEIFCLSYDEEIIIHNDLYVQPKNRATRSITYENALRNLIGTWADRIETILTDGMSIRVDLTGGVDSRVIMSLLMFTLRRMRKFDLLSSPQINVNSQPSKIDDFRTAKIIANEYGFPLNNKNRENYITISGKSSLEAWRHFNLGRYAPHILPAVSQNSNIITFPGVGGGEHRPFYETFARGKERFGAYLDSYRSVFSSDQSFKLWVEDIREDLSTSISPHDTNLSAAIRHYRRHRGRHHSSKQPGNEIMGVILGSKGFYECTLQASHDDVENNQILFDVMFSCEEAISRLPFDDIKKAPREINFQRKTIISGTPSTQKGRIWRGQSLASDNSISPSRNQCLNDAVLAALENPQVASEIGSELVKKIHLQLQDMGDTNLHQNGALLHYALLIELVQEVT